MDLLVEAFLNVPLTWALSRSRSILAALILLQPYAISQQSRADYLGSSTADPTWQYGQVFTAQRDQLGDPSWRSHWRCRALSGNHALYLVDHLDARRKSFEVAIYEEVKEDSLAMFPEAKYVASIAMKAELQGGSVFGKGLLGERSLEITALGRTPQFVVQDSRGILAIGRCSPLFEWASDQERAGIRECLELVRTLSLGRGWGAAVSEVDRFACEQDSRSHIKDLQQSGEKSHRSEASASSGILAWGGEHLPTP